MKSLNKLLQLVLIDLGIRCDTSTALDYKYIESRIEHEGLSFLTITLPAFGRSFERALDRGYVASDLFNGFRWKGGLPTFLSGFLRQVFDPVSGRLLDEPSIASIFSVRQISLMYKKLEVPCSRERTRNAFAQYVQCDKEVSEWYDARLLDELRSTSSRVWSDLLGHLDAQVYNGLHIPKHGPGSVADRLTANQRYNLRTWHDRLEYWFPSLGFVFPNDGWYQSLDDVTFLEPGAEPPVRVISVPKTLKTPRIIALEPACMQYTQQSLMELFAEGFRGFYLPRKLVDYSSQEPNRGLALKGSRSGNLATLDLSEASDRVSNLHVEALLGDFPSLSEAVQACRSLTADVPGFGVIPLSRFASMGSALTFPIESLFFATLCIMGIESKLKRHLTSSELKKLRGRVRVYGDDIIVPVDYVSTVIETLESFGLKVNSDKSFWTGKFRESCGGDFYDGLDVGIVKVGKLFPRNRSDVEELIATVELRNRFAHWRYSDFEHTVAYLDNLISGLIPFPEVSETSQILGRVVEHPTPMGYCSRLHIPLVKGCRVTYQYRSDPLSGSGALMKYFLKRGNSPIEGDHLSKAGRPVSSRIKYGWAPLR